METSSATSGTLPTTHMRMKISLELGSSPALCSTAANLGTPVQNIPPSPTVDTAPAFLTPLKEQFVQDVGRRTHADLSVMVGVTLVSAFRLVLEDVQATPTWRVLGPRVHNMQLRLPNMNVMDNVRTSPPILERTHARPA